jgi:hypothetical protein
MGLEQSSGGNTMNAEPNQSDVIVVLEHPLGRVEVSLEEWISIGPGARPLVRPVEAKRKGSGEPLPLSVIPLRYRNNRLSRTLIVLVFLIDPWE